MVSGSLSAMFGDRVKCKVIEGQQQQMEEGKGSGELQGSHGNHSILCNNVISITTIKPA